MLAKGWSNAADGRRLVLSSSLSSTGEASGVETNSDTGDVACGGSEALLEVEP
jgi:hypothetical protein